MTPDPDDDLRDLLRQRAAEVQPRGTFADVERKIAADAPIRPRWERPWVLGVAAVLALLLGFAAMALVTTRSDDGRVDTTGGTTSTAPSTSSPTTDPEVLVGPDPSTVPSTPETAPGTVPPETTTSTSSTTTTTIPPTTPLTAASRVTLRGIDGLELPLSLADVAAETGQELVPQGEPLPGSSCGFVQPTGGPPQLSLMTDGDRVVRVDVSGESPVRTLSGVGIGSTEAEVRAAYPEATFGPSKYTQLEAVLTDPDVPDSKLTIVFLDGAVVSYRSGVAEFVDYVEGCS